MLRKFLTPLVGVLALLLDAAAVLGDVPPPPMLVVDTCYPAASADVVAQTIAAPIQQQLNGSEGSLNRVAGVGDVAGFGLSDYGLRIWLDPEKLAACNLVVNDVMKALRAQNVRILQPALDPKKDKIVVQTLGRLTDPAEFADIILK